ncbi:MAG: hypothetical protein M3176_01725 [Chloroflexota bacterium]|nr:hypothetical protein [Chloroflexota bacterium]
MNVSEVAEEMGIQPGAVRDAIARGRMAAIRKGGGGQRAGFLLIEKTEVERYRREHLGKRGLGSASHPLHGVGRRKKDAPPPVGRDSCDEADDGFVLYLLHTGGV